MHDAEASGEIVISAGGVRLPGFLAVPADAHGIVLFAHGSGSSRHSPRNRRVAKTLNDAGFATLLFDLLSETEHRHDQLTGKLRFDIPMLAERLVHAVDHVSASKELEQLPVGLFGASTGAAAAVIAAADRADRVNAVVCRGGRPDLAEKSLPKVRAPVLLIVGGKDQQVIDLNQHAATQLVAEHEIAIVQDASHLFEEPGKIDVVERLAVAWFERWLQRQREERA